MDQWLQYCVGIIAFLLLLMQVYGTWRSIAHPQSGAVHVTRAELDAQTTIIKQDMTRLETDLKTNINKVDTDVKAKIDKVDTDLRSGEERTRERIHGIADRVHSLTLKVEAQQASILIAVREQIDKAMQPLLAKTEHHSIMLAKIATKLKVDQEEQ